MSASRPYTLEEDRYIMEHYSGDSSIDDIARTLRRSARSIIGRANNYLKVYRSSNIRKFECADCGRTVITHGEKDKRTKFCCARCEKKFWRHPTWANKGSSTTYQGGLRHALSVQNSDNKNY